MSNLKPIGNRVVIEVKKPEEKTAGGIVLPDTASKDRPQEGNVIAVGPGKTADNGSVVAMQVKKGDKVLFSKYSGTEVKLDSKEYLILSENDILAIID
ncbi:MAG: co-chaperone GroES [Candidatus Muiribacteriota bacterium]|jgi:chaperonin GroES